MRYFKPLELLLALLLMLGSFAATTAVAEKLPTTVPVITEANSEDAQEQAPKEHSTKRQILILVAFAAGVGVLAALYGIITMRYNQEKMDDMTEESRKLIQKMRDEQDE